MSSQTNTNDLITSITMLASAACMHADDDSCMWACSSTDQGYQMQKERFVLLR